MPNNDAYRFSVRDDTTWIHSGSEEGGESLSNSGIRIFHLNLEVAVTDMVSDQHNLYEADFIPGVMTYVEDGQLVSVFDELSEQIAVGVNTYNVIAYDGEAYVRLVETGANYVMLSNLSANAEEMTPNPEGNQQVRLVKLTGDASFTVTIGANDEISV